MRRLNTDNSETKRKQTPRLKHGARLRGEPQDSGQSEERSPLLNTVPVEAGKHDKSAWRDKDPTPTLQLMVRKYQPCQTYFFIDNAYKTASTNFRTPVGFELIRKNAHLVLTRESWVTHYEFLVKAECETSKVILHYSLSFSGKEWFGLGFAQTSFSCKTASDEMEKYEVLPLCFPPILPDLHRVPDHIYHFVIFCRKNVSLNIYLYILFADKDWFLELVSKNKSDVFFFVRHVSLAVDSENIGKNVMLIFHLHSQQQHQWSWLYVSTDKSSPRNQQSHISRASYHTDDHSKFMRNRYYNRSEYSGLLFI